MRYLFTFICALALGVMGCSETSGTGGSGGTAGTGGGGGTAGTGGMPEVKCEIAADCYQGNACTEVACTDGICNATPVEDGNDCGPMGASGTDAGTCQQGKCRVACTERGIRDAIAADSGLGPYTFDCDGPTTVVTVAEIAIDRDVILDGEGNLTVDGDLDHRVFSVPERVTVELRGLTVARGRVVADEDDLQRAGAGILNGGDLTLVNCTVRDNAAEHDEDCYGPFGCLGYGGGIESGPFGSLTLRNSTVSGNVADVGGGILKFGFASLTVTNSTISGNTAREAEYAGAGIENGPDGRLTVTNSTVSGNTGPAISNYGTATVMNSLVDGDCAEPQEPVTSLGNNIESPGDTCGFDKTGDQSGVTEENLNLGPLADNGGPTETHALLPGSVAIDVIPAVDCVDAEGEPLVTDQRGFPRDSMCDVGAFEVQP